MPKKKSAAPLKNKKPATKPASIRIPASVALEAPPVAIKPAQLRREAAALLKVGERVIPLSGPYKGVRGEINSISEAGYVDVMFLGNERSASLTFDAYKLQKA